VADEKQKLCTIRIQSVETATEHLTVAALDPRNNYVSVQNTPSQKFPIGSATIFYSNNIAYSMDKNGRISRVITLEESKRIQ
jgi:hypothetical protein